ncbi:DUF465 domain-containing protein [Pseudomonas putida]|uniref:DUF465 domain-containing protein n=1 Tax=Pseudomonas putida TaxID=303 RepID=UPI0023643B53|nr:DUF465 domain-containing protein [Pseudomonas putida]MDD2054790.1 DUF465 domain-containing protein [Pseudomonas putida]
MPVPHDLYQDLSCTKEEIQQRRAQDARLDSLLDDYREIDKHVLDIESMKAGNVSDDELRKFKERRLLIKDKILQRLKAQG